MRGRLGLGRDCRAVARGAARADVALLPAHVGVVERVAPRPRLAVGIAAVVVAAQPGRREVDGGLGVVPRDLLGPHLARPPRLGGRDLAAIVLAVLLRPALARVVEAVPTIEAASLDVARRVAHAVADPRVRAAFAARRVGVRRTLHVPRVLRIYDRLRCSGRDEKSAHGEPHRLEEPSWYTRACTR